MKHLGDILKMNGAEIEPVTIISGGSPCFPAGTMILTENGAIPIEGISVGDKVLTHLGRYRKVTDFGMRGAGTMVLSDGEHQLECTFEHPIYSSRDGKEPKTPQYTEAQNMIGMYWAMPREIVGGKSRHSWFRVTSVNPIGELKTVYNITVDEDNTYVADGIVVHNCQDLSVAGKRAGLTTEDGELTRSGLYMEQMRINKEMRQATGGRYPRYSIWENVPGALSSKEGKDFAAVLEEVIRVNYPGIPPIEVPKGGWPNAGVIFAGRMSVAWRIHDAQYWGVPQRRRRICCLADFNGFSAPYLVFGDRHEHADFTPAKGKKRGAIVLRLETDELGDDSWVEDKDFPIYHYNVTEMPDDGPSKLWDVNTGEYLDIDSLLSNILETGGVPLNYYLSAKACRGILTRAARRGKTLPEELRLALEEQIVWMEQLNGKSEDEDEDEEDGTCVVEIREDEE